MKYLLYYTLVALGFFFVSHAKADTQEREVYFWEDAGFHDVYGEFRVLLVS